MKKVYIIIAILASLVLVAMLTGIGYGMNKALSPQVVRTQVPTPTPTPEETPTPEPEDKKPYWVPENLEELKANAPEPIMKREYINYEYGYKITFPEDWMGWFLIEDNEPDDVSIMFYGKSEASRYCGESIFDYGILMFNIVTEETIYEKDPTHIYYDGRTKIGTANGVDIYRGETYREMGKLRQASESAYYSEKERELAAADDERLDEMRYDVLNEGILEATFEEIK